MDLLVWGEGEGMSPEDLAADVRLDADGVEIAYEEIDRRRVATRYLHRPAIVDDPRRLTCAASLESCAPTARGRWRRIASCAWPRALRHRGPDGFGFARDEGAGFVSTRLAIFDMPGGWQPMEAAPPGT